MKLNSNWKESLIQHHLKRGGLAEGTTIFILSMSEKKYIFCEATQIYLE